MKLKIDEEACIGCGICQSLCPDCFLLENGTAKIINTNFKNCNLNEIAENCPSQAILIEEE